MKFLPKEPPRTFTAKGVRDEITISDCGRMSLAPDEQVTFLTEDDREYDVVRKDWGFYATPSMNGRLRSFGFRSALVLNSQNKIYVMLVQEDRMEAFFDYVKRDDQRVLCWLDHDETADRLAQIFDSNDIDI